MKFVHRIALLVASMAVSLGIARTQEKPPQAKPEPAQAQAAMSAAKPSPQIEKLAKMISGRWRVSEAWDANDLVPKGGQGYGYAVIWSNPGGLWIEQQYHSSGPLGAFAGHGVIWWDDKAQGYKSLWCDNMTPGGCTVANGLGKWEGNNVVFDDQQETMGKKQVTKEVMATADSSSFTLTMSGSENGGAMKRGLVITYTSDGGPGSVPSASSNNSDQ
jgi:hypothetical protein